MHKTKKRGKSETKIPKPIKIKKEKTEEDRSLHAMPHYIDDRLELVKQIFGTLKPKTITNLAPDFLKKKSMDEIEELCLNELLCISTKRLLSIINATKCPTDTESSSDSDVERQEEHISLEEISSDSEIEGSSTNAAKRKSTTATAEAKKDAKKNTEENGNDGQISVLELLELQARARAIRSQLALEPVTKIEVDSDNEGKRIDSATSKTVKLKHARNDRKRNSNEQEPTNERTSKANKSLSTTATCSAGKHSKSKEAATDTTIQPKELEKRTSKKIKLKRNYRNSSSMQKDSQKQSETEEQKATIKVTITNEVKKENASRSPSPDVIPIVPEPETLLISDSSDADGEAVQPRENMPKKNEAAEQEQKIQTDTIKKARKLTETEEGEITDNEEEKREQNPANVENPLNEQTIADDQDVGQTQKKVNESTPKVAIIDESEETLPVVETTVKTNEHAKGMEEKEPTDTAMSKQESITTPEENSIPNSTNLEEYDDQNDDVISLEGGDLESEMIEHLEGESNTKLSFVTRTKEKGTSKEDDADIISLDSSEEEHEKNNAESWHSRYLKSSKVSKVLATSRLGKRVRDKIKKSKRSKKDSAIETTTDGDSAKTGNTFTSKHEDGSVEQYKELLEMRQRKSS